MNNILSEEKQKAEKAELFTKDISIPAGRISVDRKNFLLRFPVSVSPGAATDNIYRIIIRQPALDCDCNKFWHEMCIDITVGKCG